MRKISLDQDRLLTKEKIRDIVCGREFGADESAYEAEFEGKMYYFCSGMCRERFERSPGEYAPTS